MFASSINEFLGLYAGAALWIDEGVVAFCYVYFVIANMLRGCLKGDKTTLIAAHELFESEREDVDGGSRLLYVLS